jgi:ribosomal protein S18 acetylase RimI-like enzyme
MVEGNDAEKTGIEVVAIVPEIKEEATVALVEAFKTEETTAYHLDMKHPGSIRRMAIFDDIFIQLYMEAGRPLYAAVEDGHVIGAGIVRDPRIRISKRRSVALILPDLLQILLLFARRPVRSLHIMVAAKHPKGLIEPYFTFEALGVHPDHQGRGAGKALMCKAQSLVEENPGISGMYLNTGSEKNRAFYESLGYDTLRIEDLGQVKVYHMFWQNPSFS